MGLFRKYSDNDIIDGIRRQDNRILSYLYDVYYDVVRDYVKRNSGTEDDIYEVLQEAIVALYRQVINKDFKLTTDLKGYFFGIMKNLWNSHLRYRSRLTSIEIDPPDNTGSEDVSMAIYERIVSRSFPLLGEDCQRVLKLFGDGFSYKDIAGKMGFRNEIYARRKKYLCKEALMEIIKTDPEFHDLGPL